MNKQITILVGVIVMVLTACGPQAPQIPSQRKGQTPPLDTAQLALMELNQQLSETADKQLSDIVRTKDEPYAMYEGNTWATIIDKGDMDAPTPKFGEEWTIHLIVYNLDEQLLMDSERTYSIGKRELPYAVDRNILEWHKGARIRMYAPWYSAYGMQGTEHIPPYENVIIDLELK